MTARVRVGLALLVAAVYSACYAAIKIALPYAPPLRFAGLREIIAGTVIAMFLAIRRQSVAPPTRLWPATLLLVMVGGVAGFSAMFLGPRHTGAGLASVLGNTGPVIVIVLAALWLGERITLGKLTALALGMVGIGFIALPRQGAGADPLAILLPLAAAVSGASESVIVKRAAVGRDVLRVTSFQFLGGGIALLLLSLALETQPVVWKARFVGPLLFLALFGSAFATALWYWLVQQDDVGRLSLVLLAVPVFGLALGALLFAETVSFAQGVGAALIVVACLVAAVFVRQPSGPPIDRER